MGHLLRGFCVSGHLPWHSPYSDCSAGKPNSSRPQPGEGARMAKRRWTVVFVPHGSEPSRIVEVSYGLIKLAVGRLALGLAAALLVGYATMSRTADLSRTSRL